MFTFEIKNTLTDCSDSGSRFLQSEFWAEFKSANGWKNLCFIVSYKLVPNSDQSVRNDAVIKNSFTVHVLVRSFGKAGIYFSLAYIPMMPELIFKDKDAVEQIGEYAHFMIDFSEALKRYLPKNTLCVRFDPPLDFNSCEDRDFYTVSLKTLSAVDHLNIKKTKTDIQPPDTTILDITQSEENMLSAMRNKWRYNIRYAEKHGVTVTAFHATDEGFNEALETFYELDQTTSKRDGNAIHAKSYYKELLELSAEKRKSSDAPLVTLYVASAEGENLAAIITLFCKFEAVYLFGASGNIKRNLMPAYLLQWTAIQDAKKYGCPCYDFYGMPPTDNPKHPMFGLYLFKTGFGGKIVHRAGSIDVPLSFLYKPYIFAENFRAFYHKRIVKIFAGRQK